METEYDIKYATPQVAAKFATENVWQGPTLGFHGLWNIPRFLSRMEVEYVIENIPSYFWNDLSKVQSLIDVLIEQNYRDIAEAIYLKVTKGQ